MSTKALILALFSALILSLSPVALTDITHTEKTVSGHGKSQNAALIAALNQAIAQTQGISPDTVSRTQQSWLNIVSPYGNTTIEQDIRSQVLHLGKGLLQSYDVIDSQFNSDSKSWKVTVKAQVLSYQQPQDAESLARASLPSIAILPFRFDDRSDGKMLEAIQSALETSVLRSKTYRVLNRQFKSEHQQELNLLSQQSINPRQALRLGQLLGADYLLLGKLRGVSLINKPIEFYGSKIDQLSLTGSLDYQLVLSATGEVIDSRQLSVGDIKVQASDNKLHDAKLQIYQLLAQRVKDSLLADSHPIKTVAIESPYRIILNQGDSRLNVKQKLNVFGASHHYQHTDADPSKSKKILVDGAFIGSIELIEVKADYAVAKWIDGDFGAFNQHSIIRPYETIKIEKAKPPARYSTPGSSDKPLYQMPAK